MMDPPSESYNNCCTHLVGVAGDFYPTLKRKPVRGFCMLLMLKLTCRLVVCFNASLDKPPEAAQPCNGTLHAVHPPIMWIREGKRLWVHHAELGRCRMLQITNKVNS